MTVSIFTLMVSLQPLLEVHLSYNTVNCQFQFITHNLNVFEWIEFSEVLDVIIPLQLLLPSPWNRNVNITEVESQTIVIGICEIWMELSSKRQFFICYCFNKDNDINSLFSTEVTFRKGQIILVMVNCLFKRIYFERCRLLDVEFGNV